MMEVEVIAAVILTIVMSVTVVCILGIISIGKKSK